MSPSVDQPICLKDGLSSRRERRWGLIGGTLGSLVGGGAAVVGVFIDGMPWYTSGPYPLAFTEARLLALDLYLLIVLIVGVGFSTAGVVLSRRSPYPRTDAFGAGLLGTILMGISGLILFIRLVALIRAG
jgi:hypothetical protein